MSQEMNRLNREAREKYGDVPVNAVGALLHVLAVYADAQDDLMILQATFGVYGDGVRTGLTMGNLRVLAAELQLD